VSNPVADAMPDRAALDALERAVGDLLDRISWLHDRAALAEDKREDLQELLQRFTGTDVDAGQMMARLRVLESENADLRSRLEQGRAGIDRLLAKIRFLESQQ
jgi:predicted RNase H-like nuclease (RuvC/YqgF family)